nr:hypothetical protein [Tanacetum cinerariifolium]
TQSKPVSITAVKPVSAAMPKSKVTRPRHTTHIVTNTNSPIRRHLTRSPSPKVSNSRHRVTAVKAAVVNAAQVSAAMPKSKVTRPRHTTPIVTNTNSPIRRHLTRSPSPKVSNSCHRVTAVKAAVVNAAQ